MGFQSHDPRQERTRHVSPISKKTMELLRPSAVWCDCQWGPLDEVSSGLI